MNQRVMEEDGVFFGFCLGADYCAEHEYGIQGLQDSLGIDPKGKTLGIASYQITTAPKKEDVLFAEDKKKGHTYLVFDYYAARDYREDSKRFFKNPPRSLYGTRALEGAWDEKSFGFRVDTDTLGDKAKEIFDAFMAKDLAVCFSRHGSNPFDRSGLCLIIVSKFPKGANEALIEEQKAKAAFEEVVDATGLRNYVPKNKYYALNPKPDASQPDGVIWWLNPQDQINNNHGWFATQDLKDWVDNKPGNKVGVVVKPVMG